MKQIDFKNLAVQFNVEGGADSFDSSKIVGNVLHAMSYDIALHDLGKEIYYSEVPVEIPERLESSFIQFIQSSSMIAAPVKLAIIEQLRNSK